MEHRRIIAEIDRLLSAVAVAIAQDTSKLQALKLYRRSLHNEKFDDFETVWVLYDSRESTCRIYMNAQGTLLRNGVAPRQITTSDLDEQAAVSTLATLQRLVGAPQKKSWRRIISWLQ